jgi:primosomal protein N'
VTEELKRLLGPTALAEAGGAVAVGSEADLAGLAHLDLAVAVDADGLILGSHFRAAEEALRVLARVAGMVGTGGGRRALVQTSLPDHGVIRALQRGDPTLFLEEELEERRRLRFPPASELVVVELRGAIPPGAEAGLVEAAGAAAVMGPAHRPDNRHRWLIQGDDLTRFRHQLRALVQKWREAGTTVRIDADPIDL